MNIRAQIGMVSCAGRGLQPRPERFDAAAIFGPYVKPFRRGGIPRPARTNKEEVL